MWKSAGRFCRERNDPRTEAAYTGGCAGGFRPRGGNDFAPGRSRKRRVEPHLPVSTRHLVGLDTRYSGNERHRRVGPFRDPMVGKPVAWSLSCRDWLAWAPQEQSYAGTLRMITNVQYGEAPEPGAEEPKRLCPEAPRHGLRKGRSR